MWWAAVLIAIETTPAGVAAKINGTEIGTTPIVAEISADKPLVHVELARPGKEPLVEVVTPPKGTDNFSVVWDLTQDEPVIQGWVDATLLLRFQEGWTRYTVEQMEAGTDRVRALLAKRDFEAAARVCETIELVDTMRVYCLGIVHHAMYERTMENFQRRLACYHFHEYLRRAPAGYFVDAAQADINDITSRGVACDAEEQQPVQLAPKRGGLRWLR